MRSFGQSRFDGEIPQIGEEQERDEARATENRQTRERQRLHKGASCANALGARGRAQRRADFLLMLPDGLILFGEIAHPIQNRK